MIFAEEGFYYVVKNKGADRLHIYCAADLCLCLFLYPPQTVFVGGYTVFRLSDRPNDRPTERVSVTFCFLNNFKNH